MRRLRQQHRKPCQVPGTDRRDRGKLHDGIHLDLEPRGKIRSSKSAVEGCGAIGKEPGASATARVMLAREYG
jgi:hypothetical protein